MQVKDVMTSEVEVISPDATLQEAAEKMQAFDVGPVPVCDGDRVVGMITDRDITVRATAVGQSPFTGLVRDAMTPNPVFCYEDQDVTEAARLMEEHQIRRLIVLNREDRLVGIVSLGDLAVESGDEQLSGEALKEISQPNFPDTKS